VSHLLRTPCPASHATWPPHPPRRNCNWTWATRANQGRTPHAHRSHACSDRWAERRRACQRRSAGLGRRWRSGRCRCPTPTDLPRPRRAGRASPPTSGTARRVSQLRARKRPEYAAQGAGTTRNLLDEVGGRVSRRWCIGGERPEVERRASRSDSSDSRSGRARPAASRMRPRARPGGAARPVSPQPRAGGRRPIPGGARGKRRKPAGVGSGAQGTSSFSFLFFKSVCRFARRSQEHHIPRPCMNAPPHATQYTNRRAALTLSLTTTVYCCVLCAHARIERSSKRQKEKKRRLQHIAPQAPPRRGLSNNHRTTDHKSHRRRVIMPVTALEQQPPASSPPSPPLPSALPPWLTLSPAYAAAGAVGVGCSSAPSRSEHHLQTLKAAPQGRPLPPAPLLP
jgi:hypothetical protein